MTPTEIRTFHALMTFRGLAATSISTPSPSKYRRLKVSSRFASTVFDLGGFVIARLASIRTR